MNIQHCMLRPLVVLSALIGLAPGAVFAGDFVVIVNKANTTAVDKAMVSKIYQGDIKSWPGGVAVAMFDLPDDDPLRAAFCTEVIGKSRSSMKAMWAQLQFAGKALPPKQVASDEEVKKAVSSNKGGIGYIKADAADDTVKVAIK